jgi:hypothetical protein
VTPQLERVPQAAYDVSSPQGTPQTLPPGAALPQPAAAAGKEEAAPAAPAPAAAGSNGPPPEGSGGDGAECVVCWEQRPAVVLVPCGHLVLCRPCADDLMAGAHPLCPVCRQGAALAQTVYA